MIKISKEQKWAWIAGLLEGEGCFYWSERQHQIIIEVSMTDEDVLRKLHEWSGLGNVYGPYQKKKGNKLVWYWKVSRFEHTPIIIKGVLPYMGERRRAKIIELQSEQLKYFKSKNLTEERRLKWKQ